MNYLGAFILHRSPPPLLSLVYYIYVRVSKTPILSRHFSNHIGIAPATHFFSLQVQ
jgi:hypothetical protein